MNASVLTRNYTFVSEAACGAVEANEPMNANGGANELMRLFVNYAGSQSCIFGLEHVAWIVQFVKRRTRSLSDPV